MRKLLSILVFVGSFNLVGWTQSGHYFLSHYKPANDNLSYLSFDIQQDNNGILYFANRSGVLSFDGRSWEMVPVHGAVYALAVSSSGDVFVAGASGFGKLGLNIRNQLDYLPLSDSLPRARNIFAAHALGSDIYFLNEGTLVKYDSKSGESKVLFSASLANGSFTGLFQIGSDLFLNTENEGLKKIVAEQLETAHFTSLHGSHLVFSERSPDGKTYLVATDDHRFFLQSDNENLVELKPKDLAYLSANVVANCAWVTSKTVAVGTLRGGVLFFDIETGLTQDIINYHSGLPDNEIFTLHTDRHQGLWVGHDYGFTRAAPFLPFRTFNHYPGLVGNLLSVQSLGDQVYVGTTLGLFLLTKAEVYEDEIYNVTQTLTTTTKSKEVTVTEERQKSKRGLLGIFKKKKPKEETPPPVTNTKPVTITKQVQVQKKRKKLRSVEYIYKPVDGVTGKVDHLMVIGSKLLCGGVGGVFEIKGVTAVQVTAEPVRTIYYSRNLKQLLVGTYDDEIHSFKPTATAWTEANFPDSLSMHADYIFEDNLQDLWICSRDEAVKVEIENGEILDAEAIPLPQSSIEKTVGLAYGQEVYLTQNGSFYHYASFKNAFVKYDSFPGPKKYFASAGYFWYYDGHKWTTVDKSLRGSIKTEWLALFPDIRFLAPAEHGKSLWVITASNELYKFSSDPGQINIQANPLFLKAVRSQQLRLSPRGTLMVDEGESALTFEFIQPEYVSLQAVEYRYWVQGHQPTWTEWSSVNNVINFPFLPPGKYKVMVESKDLFDNVTKLDTIDFNVVPPFWKRPWFYALEFLFFGALVVLSLQLKGAGKKYHYLSSFLSALTVIMLIQFVQTIASANIAFKSNVVVDFFIQVMIALLVLPVEEFLRAKMRKADAKRR
jgi:hypothetical protein